MPLNPNCVTDAHFQVGNLPLRKANAKKKNKGRENNTETAPLAALPVSLNSTDYVMASHTYMLHEVE
jgi:hypothetical protein